MAYGTCRARWLLKVGSLPILKPWEKNMCQFEWSSKVVFVALLLNSKLARPLASTPSESCCARRCVGTLTRHPGSNSFNVDICRSGNSGRIYRPAEECFARCGGASLRSDIELSTCTGIGFRRAPDDFHSVYVASPKDEQRKWEPH